MNKVETCWKAHPREKVALLRKQVRNGLFIAFVVLFLGLLASSAIAFPGNSDACTDCHSTSTGMTLTASATTITTEPGATFDIEMQVQGVSNQDGLTLRFSSEVDHNALFDFGTFGPEGMVNDNEAGDDNSAEFAIEATYSITAPTTAGTYSLHAYAAQSGGMGIDLTITVNVLGEGPSFALINATPIEPLDTDPVHIEVNVTSEVGISEVQVRVKQLTDLLVEGVRSKGWRVQSPRTASEWSGIVSFSSAKHDIDKLRKHLREEFKIVVTKRVGRLRASPHFYNSGDEIRQLIDALPNC